MGRFLIGSIKRHLITNYRSQEQFCEEITDCVRVIHIGVVMDN